MASSKLALFSAGHSYWRTISEEALGRIRFTTDEPEALDRVTYDPPPPGSAHIEIAYDIKGRRSGMARCSHCRRTNHFKGFVVVHEDATRRLVGWKCGGDLYGADFENLFQDFKAAKDRQSYLEIKKRTVSVKEILLDGLVRLAAHPSNKHFVNIRRDLRQVFPDHMYRKLHGSTELTITERVRDLAAEERRQDRWDEAGLDQMSAHDRKMFRRRNGLQGGEIYKEVPRRIGSLSGIELFAIETSPGAILQDLVKDVANLFVSLAEVDQKTKEMAAANKRLHELLDLIQVQVTRLDAPRRLFHGIVELEAWGNFHGQEEGAFYEREVFTLTRHDRHGSHSVSLPPDYAPPSGDFLKRVREQLRDDGDRPLKA